MLTIGQAVGHYRVIEKLGEGGMGVVYRAEDTRLGREVAIKALPAEYARDPVRRQRFEKEARAAAALNHPGIAAVYSLEAIGDELYIVFEYVRGVSLRAILESGRLSLAAAQEMATQMAEALAAAHAAGVVHRDLKPENVLRTPDGRIKILDFGLAHVEATASEETAGVRLTAPGMIVGTVWYMSPEQIEGVETDFRSDIFSFGVLLYELCAGTRPFDGATTTATISRILTAEPPPLSQCNTGVSGELDRIVRKCLRKKREERYQSTSDLRVDLEEVRRASSPSPAPFTQPQPQPTGSVENEKNSSLIRRIIFRSGATPLRWWELNHFFCIGATPVVLYFVWLVREARKDAVGLWFYYASLAFAAVLISMRLYQLALSAFVPQQLAQEVQRVEPWQRRGDLVFMGVLLAAAASVAEKRIAVAAFLGVIALGGVVTRLLIEPAVSRAAFPSSAESRTNSPPSGG